MCSSYNIIFTYMIFFDLYDVVERDTLPSVRRTRNLSSFLAMASYSHGLGSRFNCGALHTLMISLSCLPLSRLSSVSICWLTASSLGYLLPLSLLFSASYLFPLRSSGSMPVHEIFRFSQLSLGTFIETQLLVY